MTEDRFLRLLKVAKTKANKALVLIPLESRRDVIATATGKAWNKRHQCRDDREFTQWFIKICRRVSMDNCRRMNCQPVALFGIVEWEGDLIEDIYQCPSTVDELVNQLSLSAQVEALPERERDVVRLASHGYSMDEISEQLNINKGSVWRYLRNGRAKLCV